jgi:hypothetical protein
MAAGDKRGLRCEQPGDRARARPIDYTSSAMMFLPDAIYALELGVQDIRARRASFHGLIFFEIASDTVAFDCGVVVALKTDPESVVQTEEA